MASKIFTEIVKDSLTEGKEQGFFHSLIQDFDGNYIFSDYYTVKFKAEELADYLLYNLIELHDYLGGLDFVGNIYNLDGSIPFCEYAEEKQVDIFDRFCHDFSDLDCDLRQFANCYGGY